MPERAVITPELAREFLARAEADVDQERVARYADEIRNGTWEEERSTLIVFEDGVICDGFHRLHACIEADCSFPTCVETIPRWSSPLPPPSAIAIPDED